MADFDLLDQSILPSNNLAPVIRTGYLPVRSGRPPIDAKRQRTVYGRGEVASAPLKSKSRRARDLGI